MKRCCRCMDSKPSIKFNKDRHAKDGLDHYCRQCNSERLQEYRSKTQNYADEPIAMQSYIREILRTWIQDHKIFIPIKKRIRLSKQLYKKLIENPRCPYTLEKLIPRVNLSLDHIKPISRGGKHSINNLEWISRRANQTKCDMTPDEFYKFCELVLHNRTAGSD
jgi:5-methylcytosine-specific restriction endonuclease McrA